MGENPLVSEKLSYASYLLRVWREGDDPVTWQGEIESIQSGQTRRFADLVTMADFLKTQVLGEQVTEFDQEND